MFPGRTLPRRTSDDRCAFADRQDEVSKPARVQWSQAGGLRLREGRAAPRRGQLAVSGQETRDLGSFTLLIATNVAPATTVCGARCGPGATPFRCWLADRNP